MSKVTYYTVTSSWGFRFKNAVWHIGVFAVVLVFAVTLSGIGYTLARTWGVSLYPAVLVQLVPMAAVAAVFTWHVECREHKNYYKGES